MPLKLDCFIYPTLYLWGREGCMDRVFSSRSLKVLIQGFVQLHQAWWQVAQRGCGVSILGGTPNSRGRALSHLSLAHSEQVQDNSPDLNCSVIYWGEELHMESLGCKDQISSLLVVAKHQSWTSGKRWILPHLEKKSYFSGSSLAHLMGHWREASSFRFFKFVHMWALKNQLKVWPPSPYTIIFCDKGCG